MGRNGDNGKPPADLDANNSHWDPVRGYHYHVTPNYPYLVGAYAGVPAMANFRRRP